MPIKYQLDDILHFSIDELNDILSSHHNYNEIEDLIKQNIMINYTKDIKTLMLLKYDLNEIAKKEYITTYYGRIYDNYDATKQQIIKTIVAANQAIHHTIPQHIKSGYPKISVPKLTTYYQQVHDQQNKRYVSVINHHIHHIMNQLDRWALHNLTSPNDQQILKRYINHNHHLIPIENSITTITNIDDMFKALSVFSDYDLKNLFNGLDSNNGTNHNGKQ